MSPASVQVGEVIALRGRVVSQVMTRTTYNQRSTEVEPGRDRLELGADFLLDVEVEEVLTGIFPRRRVSIVGRLTDAYDLRQRPSIVLIGRITPKGDLGVIAYSVGGPLCIKDPDNLGIGAEVERLIESKILLDCWVDRTLAPGTLP